MLGKQTVNEDAQRNLGTAAICAGVFCVLSSVFGLEMAGQMGNE